ncbi:MAG: cation:proton antiporter subunit C [Phycisphaeraceae bacterium]
MITQYLAERGPYLLFVFLLVLGTYVLLSHRNFVKAIVGLYLFQTGIILLFILLATQANGTIPIVEEGVEEPLMNPLPHALMLTAIVVGVATLGVALAILRRIHDDAGTIEDRVFDPGEPD